MSKIKIGVLSDSHLKTTLHEAAIRQLVEEGANYLLHAGDLETKEHLDMLQATQLPYLCVYGNNDTRLIQFYGEYPTYQEPHYFKIGEIKIKMMHMPYYLTPDADIVISGHTHKFEACKIGETLFLNPGEVCAREKDLSECVMVEIEEGSWKVVYYSRHPSDSNWSSRTIVL